LFTSIRCSADVVNGTTRQQLLFKEIKEEWEKKLKSKG